MDWDKDGDTLAVTQDKSGEPLIYACSRGVILSRTGN